MAVDATLFNHLLEMADEKAAAGYRVNGDMKVGERAVDARRDLEALQYAVAALKDEGRKHGFSGPVDLRTR